MAEKGKICQNEALGEDNSFFFVLSQLIICNNCKLCFFFHFIKIGPLIC